MTTISGHMEAGRAALLKRIALLLAMLLPGLGLAGCFEGEQSGPEKIHWDRDACHVCRMLISDRRFAAEVRAGPSREVYKFDDLGELVIWLEDQKWKDDPKTEIWVMDFETGNKWLDARKAFYLTGRHSPMDYGFGAVEKKLPGTISFEEMRKRAIKRGPNYQCLPGHQPGQ